MTSSFRLLRRGMTPFRRRTVTAPTLIACVLLLGAGIAACGSTPSSAPLTSDTNCGSITSNLRDGTDQGAANAEQCFYQAYQKCQRATLSYFVMGVDTSNTYTFTIRPKSSGGCAVAAVDKYFFASGGGRTTVNTYACSGVARQTDALLVQGCGSVGDIPVRGVVLAATATPAR